MIQPNELRIGNFVEYHEDGLQFTVTKIDELGLGVKNDDPETAQETWIKHECFSPINLTEDWLLKFGFISNRRLREKQFKSKAVSGDVRLTLWVGTNGEGFYYSDVIQIKYIHHLQNLYFSISGEELNIN